MNINTNIRAKSISYGKSRNASSIIYPVIHFTSNWSDTALGNAKFYRDTNKRSAGAHYFVDSTSVYESISPLKIAYAVGGNRYTDYKTTGGASLYKKVTNSNSISVELCSTNGVISDATINNCIELLYHLKSIYPNLDLAKVCRHFDVTGKYCPASHYDGKYHSDDKWIGKNPTAWNNFKAKLLNKTEDYIYQGVNYNKVFDHKFYADANADLKAAFGYDKIKLFNHFINNGMTDVDPRTGKLSRIGKTIATFNVEVYASHSPDLVKAFGVLSPKTAPSYYKHYCTNGYKEGRRAI
jgi:N-acetylmuramoyl-L-alanine amidase CwlA